MYKKNTRGNRISWKGKLPIVFSFDVLFPAEFVVPVRSAIEAWNKAGGFELFRIDPNLWDNSAPTNDGRNTFYYLKNDIHGLKLEHDLALTLVTGRANQIVDTDVIINGTTNSFSASGFHVDSFDIERTALHELGHALGLVDNEDSASTMFYCESSLGFANRALDETTKQMIGCEHP